LLQLLHVMLQVLYIFVEVELLLQLLFELAVKLIRKMT
jgi:hypothetical protein